MTLAAGIEPGLVYGVALDNGSEDVPVTRLTRGGKPLHTVFVGTALKSQQFRNAPVEFADRIRIKDLFFEHEPVSFGAPR